jgi:hypothetical protein
VFVILFSTMIVVLFPFFSSKLRTSSVYVLHSYLLVTLVRGIYSRFIAVVVRNSDPLTLTLCYVRWIALSAMVASVLLTYVFPGCGCILSLFMFSSSLAAVLKVRKLKSIGVSVIILEYKGEQITFHVQGSKSLQSAGIEPATVCRNLRTDKWPSHLRFCH